MSTGFVTPPEWHPQDWLWVGFPHLADEWPGMLARAQEQIAAFANARMVVGPSGAALFNCVFCAPGTHLIDIESEPYWIHAHACLFTSCDLVWGVFEGKTTDQTVGVIHKPFTVNIPALLRRIASFG